MLCKIADLLTEIPEAGDLVPRCREYLWNGSRVDADIVIRTDLFRPGAWKTLEGDAYIYMESGTHFLFQLLKHGGMMLHASAVVLDGKAYLFSAPCGTGKSTHTRLWQQVFGPDARVINDDKPALRYVDGVWYAYGTPWCGKDGININEKAPLGGICFLKQGSENRIRRLSQQEAIQKIIFQTMRRFKLAESLNLMLGMVDRLVCTIPVFELENRPEPEAAMLSHDTMAQAAKEAGL